MAAAATTEGQAGSGECPLLRDAIRNAETRQVRGCAEGRRAWFSIESFPPKTDKGVENLTARLERMSALEFPPLFLDYTWGAGGTTSERTMELTLNAKDQLGMNPNMHLTCTNMPREMVLDALETARANGVTNIVALRGDPPKGQERWEATEGGFTCALDLVEYIREQYGNDTFNISVAGYPEGHPDRIVEVTEAEGGFDSLSETEKARCSIRYAELEPQEDGAPPAPARRVFVCRDEDYAQELDYLKRKVDAGADLIITQMFFDAEVYGTFVQDCRAKGITVPILPGIMCLNTYGGFKRMTEFCKTRVPEQVLFKAHSLRDDDSAHRNYGIAFGTQLCRRLVDLGAPGLHFYTLNLEKVVMGILRELGLHMPAAAQEGDTAADAAVAAAAAAAAAVARLDDSKVADFSLAPFGRREIQLAEAEMPGLMGLRAELGPSQPLAGANISGSLHATVQTAVLIETLKALGANVRWCSCNVMSTQDHAAAAIAVDGSASIFAWKGETYEEYWECMLRAVAWPEGDGPNLLVDDGADLINFIHAGVKAEDDFAANPSDLPDPSCTSDEKYKPMYDLLRRELQRDPQMWHRIAEKCDGVSMETTTGVQRLRQLEASGELLVAAVGVNDSVTKSKFDNVYGCRHSLPDAIMRATDVMIAGKRAVVCGYGDVGKGCAAAMQKCGAITYVTEVDPICALQAAMDGFRVVRLESVVEQADIFVTTTGGRHIITDEHTARMKNNAIVANMGHFDDEIDMASILRATESQNIKPQVDRFIYPDGHGVIVLAGGHIVNLGCATGHPSFVMSCSFTNQALAQVELWTRKEEYVRGRVFTLPKILDEKVARLHLDALGVELTILTDIQSEYIGVPKEGPYKPAEYRY